MRIVSNHKEEETEKMEGMVVKVGGARRDMRVLFMGGIKEGCAKEKSMRGRGEIVMSRW